MMSDGVLMRGWVGRLENGNFLMSSFLEAPLTSIDNEETAQSTQTIDED